MLPYRVEAVALRLTRPGELLPWIGPALRGLTAGRLKALTCRQPPAERDARWQYCAGCPHLAGCPHGLTFEPDPPADPARLFRRQKDILRPVVLAPYYPLAGCAAPGLEIPVRVIILGRATLPHAGPLLAALADAGRAPGLGPDRVTYGLVPATDGRTETGRLGPEDFPPSPGALPGTVPRLGVGLTAPLFLLRGTPEGRRRPVNVPRFADLFQAAFCTVRDLFAAYAEPLPADYHALRSAAEAVPLREHCYEPFEQPRWSNRSREHFTLRGVTGGGVYGPVPLALLPWLLWGGRWHVGTHRVAGAGGWRLLLD